MSATRARSLVLTPIVAFVLLLAGCGSDDGDNATDTSAGSSTIASPFAPRTTSEPVQTPVDKAVWYAGFKITIDQVTTPAAGEAGTVEAAATFENLGDNSVRLNPTVTLTSAGQTYRTSGLGTDVPYVPGGATNDGAFAFRVDESFTVDDALLTFGTPSVTQAMVPLGQKGELVSLEPASLDATGSTTAGSLKTTLSGGEVKAQMPDGAQTKSGRLALYLTIDVHYTPPSASYTGGFAFSDDSIRLDLPDGSSVAPTKAVAELIAGNETLRDQTVVFEVDNPPAGDYELVVIDDSGTKDVQSSIPFTIGTDVVLGQPS